MCDSSFWLCNGNTSKIVAKVWEIKSLGDKKLILLFAESFSLDMNTLVVSR